MRKNEGGEGQNPRESGEIIAHMVFSWDRRQRDEFRRNERVNEGGIERARR